MSIDQHTEAELAEAQATRLTRSHAIISGFILFHLVAILAWSFPHSSVLASVVKDRVEPYMTFSGLRQTWAMFGPHVPSQNVYLEAELTYRDGHSRIWKFPQPSDSGYYRRYFMARYLQWSTDVARSDTNAFLLPDAARFIARANAERDNPVGTVRLIRYSSPIQPPGAGQLPVHWDRYQFFTYSVKPEDVQ